MFKLDQSQYSLFSAVRSRNGCEYIYIYIQMDLVKLYVEGTQTTKEPIYMCR